MKKVWVIGHIIATFVYCACLFYWLWIFENNDKTGMGLKEDSKIIHLSLSSFIFYAFFLVERVGNYVLDLFQS
jgi:hypothetical protein